MIEDQISDKALSSYPLLSICIPTYNRGMFLSDLLESILREMVSLPPELALLGVEVAISDNASNDDTIDRISAYRDRLSITYVRQSENIGPDRNYLAAVAAAHGKFCWLMGSDDVIELGGLTRALRAASQWDVAGFSVNYCKRSFDLAKTSGVRPPVTYRQDIVIEGRDEIYQNFAGHFGFISGHVFRHDLWQEVAETGEPLSFLNGYVHVLILGRLLERLPQWGYIDATCVGWRGRNDSFATGDHVNRMMVDVIGYRAITEQLFGKNSPVTAAVMNEIAGTHILVHYRIAKVFYHSGVSLRRAAWTLTREYWRYPSFWTKLLPWMVLPAPILHGLWVGYQRGRKRLDPTYKIHPQARRPSAQ
jgi:abequosyltransferase